MTPPSDHTSQCCPVALIWMEAEQRKLLIHMTPSSNKPIEKHPKVPCFSMLYHMATIPGQASLVMGPFPSLAPKISERTVLMMLEFWKRLCRQHFSPDFILLVSIAESSLQKNKELIFQLKELKTEIQTSALCMVRGGQLG